MTNIPSPLKTILTKLYACHVHVSVQRMKISIHVDLDRTTFLKIAPLLYLLLNKFENLYLILIDGIPFCLMHDAPDHLIYNKKPNVEYIKDSTCQTCKYDQCCPGWLRGLKSIPNHAPVADVPREIIFETTQQCNLNCPICFSEKGNHSVPLKKLKMLIDECVSLDIKQVRFTGGEPLLYEDLSEALIYAKAKNRYVTVNTNATLFENISLELLKTHVDDLLISLQGFNETSNQELTRSKSNFREKVRHIIKLNDHMPRVRIGTIMSHTLIHHFDKYLYLIDKMGIRNWEVYRPMFFSDNENFIIDKNDMLLLMHLIASKKTTRRRIMIANPVPFCVTRDKDLSQQVLCGAEFDDGHSRLVVDVRGFFKPSYFIQENLGATASEAWQNPFLQKLRSLDYLPQNCQSCPLLRWCKGGSRHWAKVAKKSFFDCDPLMPT